MTAYQLIMKISQIIAPERSRELFDYIVFSMENYGGFLRTRHCLADQAVTNKMLTDRKTILLALKEPFDFSSSPFYNNDGSEYPKTLLKMQIYLSDLSDSARFRLATEHSASAGYEYPIKIDLSSQKFEILDRVVIN